MKKKILGLIVLFFGFYFIFAHMDVHTDRNQYNILPKGKLKLVSDDLYVDEAKLQWEKLPQKMNKFHQTPSPVPPIPVPYPNVEGSLEFSEESPNWKFLSKERDGSVSYEAILRPDGTYLIKGEKQGTYNYGHPSGFLGTVKHTLLDVIPHFFNDDYSN